MGSSSGSGRTPAGTLRSRRRVRLPWLLLAGALFGIFLRVHQLSLQIPADDEWHALHAVA